MPLRTQQTQKSLRKHDSDSTELILLDLACQGDEPDLLALFCLYKVKGRWRRLPSHSLIAQSSLISFLRLLFGPTNNKVPAADQIQTIRVQGAAFTKATMAQQVWEKPPVCLGLHATGQLQQLPLEALAFKDLFGWQWLGELTTTALITADSAQLSFVERPFTANNVTILADPILPPFFTKRLSGSAIEAQKIGDIYSAIGITPRQLVQAQANRKNFLALSGDNAPQVLHIATHGYSDPYTSEFSSLILSEVDEHNKTLTAGVGFFDISLMDLTNTELVVLSACSTHHGKPIQGECVSSIAWAFKAAGVKAVVGTRWKVSDEASAQFWQTFYRQLSVGIPISAALTQARLSLIHSGKWCHPKYWASYQLIV